MVAGFNRIELGNLIQTGKTSLTAFARSTEGAQIKPGSEWLVRARPLKGEPGEATVPLVAEAGRIPSGYD